MLSARIVGLRRFCSETILQKIRVYEGVRYHSAGAAFKHLGRSATLGACQTPLYDHSPISRVATRSFQMSASLWSFRHPSRIHIFSGSMSNWHET